MSAEKTIPLNFTTYPPDEMISRSQAFLDSTASRRSIREFSSEPIPVEVIENAVRAAGTAPSGANLQPWHFEVVSNPALKRRIRECAEAEEAKFYNERAPEAWLDALEPLGTTIRKPFLETAPYLIAVFSKKYEVGEDGSKSKTYYPLESVGLATGILITALHTAGLGTLTYTPNPMRFLNDVLERPDNERPFMVVVTGLPATDCTVPDIGRKSLDEIAAFRE